MENSFDSDKIKNLADKIDRIVSRRGDHYIAFLSGLLRFETISGAKTIAGQDKFEKSIHRCLEYLHVQSERLGMIFRKYDNLTAAAELDAGDQSQGCIGVAAHIDVVPVGKGWKHPPFGGTVTDGWIWGRGAQDDKGPVGSIFSALDVLASLNLKQIKDIRFLIGTLEETDEWPDVDHLMEKKEIPDMTIVPDGIFPVINAEKGMAMLDFSGKWPKREPSSGTPQIVSLKSGKRHNMVPDSAVLLLRADTFQKSAVARDLTDGAVALKEMIPESDFSMKHREDSKNPDKTIFELKFFGKSAHGAFPEKGHNAALDALRFIDMIEIGSEGLRAFARVLSKRCGLLDGSGFGLEYHHDYMGDTTVNLGVLELKPDSGKALVNVRYPVGVKSTDVENAFARVAEEESKAVDGLKIESGIHGRVQEALYISPEEHDRFLQSLQIAYETASGRPRKLKAIRGTTYAKAFPSAVAFGPLDEEAGDTEMAHEPNERISIDRYLENIKIYALALALLAYQQ